MSRRAGICAGGLLAIIVVWLLVRDTAQPPLGYFHLLAMELAWVGGLCCGYFEDRWEAKQEQERHADHRHDR